MAPPAHAQAQTEADLLAAFRAENERLRASLAEARNTILQQRKALDKCHNSTYRLSRVSRIFGVLGMKPPETDEEYASNGFLDRARQLTQRKPEMGVSVGREEKVMECLRLLLGAKQVSVKGVPPHVEFILENADRDREMAFWLNWDAKKMEYNRIRLRLEDEAMPEFAHEEGIEFDIQQGPHFLAEVLGAMYDFRLVPRSEQPASRDG